MIRTYSGGCHCGAVRFEAEIDLTSGTGKCNCSMCSKKRFWAAKIRPEQFRLLAGQPDLVDYQFNSKSVHHLFCRHCGIHAFHWADIPQAGGKYHCINVSSLDAVDVDELVAAPITYYDGRNNQWWLAPQEVRHL